MIQQIVFILIALPVAMLLGLVLLIVIGLVVSEIKRWLEK